MPDYSIRLGLTGVSTVVTGLNQAIELLGRVWSSVRQVAEAASEYQDVLEGHRVSVDAAREATQGLVDSITLHRQAAVLEQSGLQITSEQYRAVAVAAARYAEATGTDTAAAMERLTTALRSGTERGLRPFGIELERGATGAQRQAAALDQLTERFGAQRMEIDTLADAMESTANEWDRCWRMMAVTVTDVVGPAITEFLAWVRRGLTDVSNALETQHRALTEMRAHEARDRLQDLEQQAGRLGYRWTESGMQSLTEPAQAPVRADEVAPGRMPSGADLDAFISRASRRESRPVGLGDLWRAIGDARRTASTEEEADREPPPPAEPPPSGGSRRATSRGISFEDMLGELSSRAMDARISRRREYGEAAAGAKREADARREERLREEQTRQFEEAERRKAKALTATERAAQDAEKAFGAYVRRLEAANEVSRAYGDVLSQVADMVIEAAGAESRAGKAAQAVKGGLIIVEDAVQAGLEFVRAAQSAAGMDPVGAALHAATGAGFVAHAAFTAAKMGGVGEAPPKADTAAPASRGYSAPRAETPRSTQPRTSIVNVSGIYTSERVHDELRAMERDSQRRSDR